MRRRFISLWDWSGFLLFCSSVLKSLPGVQSFARCENRTDGNILEFLPWYSLYQFFDNLVQSPNLRFCDLPRPKSWRSMVSMWKSIFSGTWWILFDGIGFLVGPDHPITAFVIVGSTGKPLHVWSVVHERSEETATLLLIGLLPYFHFRTAIGQDYRNCNILKGSFSQKCSRTSIIKI